MNRRKLTVIMMGVLMALPASGTLFAQDAPPPMPAPSTAPAPPIGPKRPMMEREMRGSRVGRWWNNPEMAQKLGLTADQQKQMDDIFQQNRLKLIDLNATLQKEEVNMEPLMNADQPNEGQILSQIDKIAQARAELEKSNARMLLGIRRVLTPDQWKKLRADGMRGPKAWEPGQRRGEPGGPDGPPHGMDE